MIPIPRFCLEIFLLHETNISSHCQEIKEIKKKNKDKKTIHKAKFGAIDNYSHPSYCIIHPLEDPSTPPSSPYGENQLPDHLRCMCRWQPPPQPQEAEAIQGSENEKLGLMGLGDTSAKSKTRIWLGSYSTPGGRRSGLRRHLLCLKGSSASLNFPLSSPHLPPCALSSPKTIQRIAAAAAAASPPPDSPSSASSSVAIENPAAVTSPTSATEELTEFRAFLSPTCFLDLMANPFDVFVAPWTEETNETGDLKLWSFC
ncbi:hypothetical protein HPP92_011174 [Vanilla planifolia]|uniref:Uncharacterized protein n=1 Tax=Vanilla planifolia TaxID=51239 RepID=A0A835R021_VANPL|nr:hypothetical protein HPP92_011174 [Vanilla planifolia]